jgi:adenylate cyclase
MESWCKKIVLLFCAFLIVLAPGYAQESNRRMDSLRKALPIEKTDTGKVNIMLELAKNTGCQDSAARLQYLNEALALAQKFNWPHGICNADLVLANTYVGCFKNHGRAIRQCENALDVAERSGNKTDQVLALQQLALSYQVMAEYMKALDLYTRILALGPDLENKMNTLSNIGLVHSKIGGYALSLIYYDSSLMALDEYMIAKQGGNVYDSISRLGLLVTIGEIYISMAQYDKALANYDSVLKVNLSDKNGQKVLKVWALMGIANVYQTKKDVANAIKYYKDALAEEYHNEDEASIMNSLGNLYLKRGDVQAASMYAEGALALAEKNKLNNQLPQIYTTLGKICIAKKRFNEAVKYLQQAIDICEKSSMLIAEKDVWEALSDVYDQVGQPALALKAYKNFIAIRDSVINIEKANAMTRIMVQSENRQKILEVENDNELKMQKQKMLTYSGYFGLVVVLLISFIIYRNYNQQKKANDTISKEKQVSENLLLNILPEDTARELKANGTVKAKLFDNVTVLFTDFINFTQAAERLSSEGLVEELHNCFVAFDEIIGKYRIEKIKTVGDAYIAVSGLPNQNPEHASDIIKAAIEFSDFMKKRKEKLGDLTFSMRIGINSGTVVAGVVGVKKFVYDIWGDTVNIAARMEQYGEEGRINISQSTYNLVKDKFHCTFRGEIDAKNKGKMSMYFIGGMHGKRSKVSVEGADKYAGEEKI